MNRKHRGILIGMILGDGYVRKDTRVKNSTFSLNVCHSIKQEEYCIHKYNKIKSIFGGIFYMGYYNHRLPSTGKDYPQCRFSKGDKYFRVLHNWIYLNNKKTITRKILNYLTPEGIAYWYQDDGSCWVNNKNRMRDGKVTSILMGISTCCSLDEAEIIQTYFNEVWGIKFKIRKEKTYFSMEASTKEAHKFFSLIASYVVPSMRYKIKLCNFTSA